MQADDIARRLMEVPGVQAMGAADPAATSAERLRAIASQLDSVCLIIGTELVFVGNTLRGLADRLPTGEERLALLALRAGAWVEYNPVQSAWFFDLPHSVITVWGLTPVAALAAAGRALEEGEKHG